MASSSPFQRRGRRAPCWPICPSRRTQSRAANFAIYCGTSQSDPRGELRWSLSKIRRLVDQSGRCRIDTPADAIRLDLSDCHVDAIEIIRAVEEGIETLPVERLRTLSVLLAGDFLDGLEIDRCPTFSSWMVAQRHRFRGFHAVILERLVRSIPGDEVFCHLEKWRQLAPFDQCVHAALLDALARRGRIREGEEHLAATVRLFESDGLDPAPIRDAWRLARGGSGGSVPACRPAAATNIAARSTDVLNRQPNVSRRASIAVMPFVDLAAVAHVPGGMADGLARDVIRGLARLRSLFVIAQDTVVALRERGIAPDEASRMLNVNYVVSGSLRRQGKRFTVAVELVETCTARIVWAEVFSRAAEDTFLVIDEIGNSIVAVIAHEIETVERNRAIVSPPNSLDAWGAHHRGLWHMYRFNRYDNEQAQEFFATAIRLDPTFARAHAGLSFTHFQNVFQGWADHAPEIDRAFAAAGESLMADDRDPAAHWAMGRALWLRGSHHQSMAELEMATELSPNFKLGHCALAFVHSTVGDPRAAVMYSDDTQRLSPFDPMLAGILSIRAGALVRLGRFGEAADCAIKAAACPNAHTQVLVLALAAYSLALAGRLDEARGYLASVHAVQPHYGVKNFLATLQFLPEESAALFRNAAERIRTAR
jgi:TolB-like protein